MASEHVHKRAFIKVDSEGSSCAREGSLSRDGEHPLCIFCQRMLIQPTTDLADEEKCKFRLHVRNIVQSAKAHCPLCMLVISRLGSFRLRTNDINRFDITELDCQLYWAPENGVPFLRYNIADSILNDFVVELHPETCERFLIQCIGSGELKSHSRHRYGNWSIATVIHRFRSVRHGCNQVAHALRRKSSHMSYAGGGNIVASQPPH